MLPTVSLRTGCCALGLALGAIFLMQLWAGIGLRGLYADGAYYAEQLLLRGGFAVIEPSRMTSQLLMQAPVVLMMHLGLDSPRAVALAFSLTTNLMPFALTLACAAVLPPANRAFALFPIFVFLAAAMSSSFASVADGATAAAYAWLLLLLILFGPLTSLRLAAILVLAAGALRLHEETAFLGPILAFACLRRMRDVEGWVPRLVLAVAAALLAAGCLIAIHDVLHPRMTGNRASFVADVFRLRWLLWYGGRINMMAVPGLLAVPALALLTLRPGSRPIVAAGVFLAFAAMAVLAFVLPACAPAAFAARDNACLLSAPAMLLLLGVRILGRSWPRPTPGAATLVMALLGIAIVSGDARANLLWGRYREAMRTALTTTEGVIPWQAARDRLPPKLADALTRAAWPWTTPLMSLWLSDGPIITTIIANPPGVAWQPFDPENCGPCSQHTASP